MPVTAMCTGGTVVDMRPLPSFSTSSRVPVSATAKLTPETPISASKNFCRRVRRPIWMSWSTSLVYSTPSLSVNREATWPAFLWMAGMMMCDGFSLSSWTMYSPMSDSRLSMPWPSRKWFISISSLTMDLPLITCLACRAWAICSTIWLASSTVSAQCTLTPLRVRLASSSSSSSGSLDRARARIWLPISRRRSRSSASLKEAARLVISESIAVRKLRRS